MAYTQTQIDFLEKAIATGVLEIEYQGRRTRFQSLAEMRRVLSDMKSEVAGTSSQPRFHDTTYDRGLG